MRPTIPVAGALLLVLTLTLSQSRTVAPVAPGIDTIRPNEAAVERARKIVQASLLRNEEAAVNVEAYSSRDPSGSVRRVLHVDHKPDSKTDDTIISQWDNDTGNPIFLGVRRATPAREVGQPLSLDQIRTAAVTWVRRMGLDRSLPRLEMQDLQPSSSHLAKVIWRYKGGLLTVSVNRYDGDLDKVLVRQGSKPVVV